MKSGQRTSRRQFLRSTMNGAVITLGVPILDCVLNENGTAFASGERLPPCFATWFHGNGLTPGFWEPKKTDKGYEFQAMLKPLEPFKDKLTIFSGLVARLGGHPPVVHQTGWQVLTEGGVTNDSGLPSVDTLIGDQIGKQTRFRSIDVNASGTSVSYSRRSASAVNASEPSPLALYTRIFGPGYVDPNKADFKPDPALMVRRSVLSYYGEERQDLMRTVGSTDRARLDEYFTALRQLENQLDQSLRKPDPMEACTAAEAPADVPKGSLIENAIVNHKLFAELVAHAFACGQTRIANVVFAESASTLRTASSTMHFHLYTHEEQIDAQLGYQKMVMWFMTQAMGAFTTFLQTLDNVREGAGTLLDRTAVMSQTDHGYAKIHSLVNLPVMVAGSAAGRLKPGRYIEAGGETVARVGLTMQRAFGLSIDGWGTEDNRVTQVFSEILA